MLLFHSRSQLFPDLFWGAHHSVMHEKPRGYMTKLGVINRKLQSINGRKKAVSDNAPRVYKKCCFVLILQNIFRSMMSSPKVKSGKKNKWERNPGICPRTQSLTGSYWFEAIRSWKHQWTHGCVVRLSTSTPWDVRSYFVFYDTGFPTFNRMKQHWFYLGVKRISFALQNVKLCCLEAELKENGMTHFKE